MRVLLIDENHPLIENQLTDKGFIVDRDLTSSYEEIVYKIQNYDGLILRSRIPIDQHFIKKAKHLKFIARVGAGMENINVEAAKQHGIALINSPEGNRDAVAEHVLGMVLTLTNRLFISSNEVKNGVWKREENRGTELKSKVFGIIGYGHMGKAVAKRLSGFDMDVVFFDILPNLEDEYARQVSLKELKETADFISLHVPLTSETTFFVNKEFIEEVDKKFYLINTARGKNVLTKDLVECLQSGKIIGAGLDVLEYEKSSFESLSAIPPDLHYLLSSDKVIITPHIAGWTHESRYNLAQVIVDKIDALFS